ncbi:MAG: hypothetical protein JWO36_6740 [Myxococcales bacterium]|nr:hypothetical protein [Myxococcales bacterium]
MQYTLRNVPDAIDALLRRRAREEGKSLNEVAVEALKRGLGLAGELMKNRSLDDVAGKWQRDRATDEVLADQRRIDPDLWR